MLSLLDILAILLCMSAFFGYVNYHYLKLPASIGLVVMALFASFVTLLIDWLIPSLGVAHTVRSSLIQIDFHEVLLNGFLSALLFAGALHVNLEELAARKWAIGIMASFGVLLSTFVVGGLMSLLAGQIGFEMPFIWWLVFGALISPTDPVAVLSILKTVNVPPLLKAKIAGESLFNDGVGVVIFIILLAIATSGNGFDLAIATKLFVSEAVGGALLGMVFGYIAYRLMMSVDEHNLEVLITLGLVIGAYALALHIHVSGPIAVVVAGLFIGNHGAKFAMSEKTREHVFQFWSLLDELLNAILFLLIGLEVLILSVSLSYLMLAFIAIPVVLLARLTAVSLPIKLLSIRENFTEGAISILTWGGLRGGISVALALSLPKNEYQPAILAATYAVVVFSIIVQGLTMEKLVKRVIKEENPEDLKGKYAK